MPDYGHRLRFGSFITPVNRPPARAVERAQLSEDLGLDLVTFQDHPYQAGFHDTWTLLSWVAAKTSRISVSGNVLNLPLRQPAVLARSVASLDLLSEGRVALGLGAGWAWDAIAAMGGPRLTTGESITALGEAIDVIRGTWDAGDPSPLVVEGAHHRAVGTARGPAPAHEVPIWLGAYKPRMLRLIGTKADGWLPGLPILQPGDLGRGNRVIDEAARAAGRDPRGITRLLNVTPRDAAADLAQLAVEDGVSVLVLISDDPAELRRFAERTAPEVRDRVGEARERGGRGAVPQQTRAPGTASAPGVAGDPVPASLAARAVLPGGAGYARYTSTYFRGGSPALVLRPSTPAQVQDAVRYAGRHREVPLGLLSGGHGLSGRSVNHGGIVIDVGALDGVEPLGGRRVRIGPGARWWQVARTLAPLGLAISSGDHGEVGVGGLATAGGIGWLVRQHGLTIDHLRSVDVVTADGALVRASEQEHPDLFWAVRGAGANFGVATSFEFEAQPVGRVAFAQLVFAVDDLSVFLQRWGATIEAADRSVTGTLMLGPTPPGQRATVMALVVVASDDAETAAARLQPITEIAPLLQQSAQLVDYDALVHRDPGGDDQHGRGEPRSRSGLVRHLSPPVADALAALFRADGRFVVSLRSAGGAVGDVPADATAYAGRLANFALAVIGGGTEDFERRWADVLPGLVGSYLSFETDTGPDALARAFPPAHLRRLRDLKGQWDPTGLFRDNFPIDPGTTDRDDALQGRPDEGPVPVPARRQHP